VLVSLGNVILAVGDIIFFINYDEQYRLTKYLLHTHAVLRNVILYTVLLINIYIQTLTKTHVLVYIQYMQCKYIYTDIVL
jgi:hypothetical protein